MKSYAFFIFITLNVAHSQVSKVDWFRKSGEDTARVGSYGVLTKFLASQMNLRVGSAPLDSMLTVQHGGHFLQGLRVEGGVRLSNGNNDNASFLWDPNGNGNAGVLSMAYLVADRVSQKGTDLQLGAPSTNGTIYIIGGSLTFGSIQLGTSNSPFTSTAYVGVKSSNAKPNIQEWYRSSSTTAVASIDTNGTFIANNLANNNSRLFWDATSNGGAGVLSLSYISTDKVYQKGTDLQIGSGVTNGSTFITSGTSSFASIQLSNSGAPFTSTSYVGVKANNSRPNIQEWYRSASYTAIASIDTNGIFTLGMNAAQSGQIRIGNNAKLTARNSTNSADIDLIYVGTDDDIRIGGSSNSLRIPNTLKSTAGSISITNDNVTWMVNGSIRFGISDGAKFDSIKVVGDSLRFYFDGGKYVSQKWITGQFDMVVVLLLIGVFIGAIFIPLLQHPKFRRISKISSTIFNLQP